MNRAKSSPLPLTARAPRGASPAAPTVGDPFPSFALPALAKRVGGSVRSGTSEGFGRRWLLLLYWPTDFAAAKGPDVHGFAPGEHVRVFGVAGARAKSGSLPFPVLADPRGDLARALGLRRPEIRASYLVDPEGVIRWISLEDLASPRPFEEALRALAAVPRPGPREVSRRLECMCAWCRQVQGPDGRWQSVESFIEARLPVEFTHGICPTCLELESGRARRRSSESRRSERVVLRVPVRLEGEGAVHSAHTAVVNRHGAVLLSPIPFAVRASLRLATLDSETWVHCRVVWYGGREAPGLHKIGIEFLEDRPDFWGPYYEASLPEA